MMHRDASVPQQPGSQAIGTFKEQKQEAEASFSHQVGKTV
jgi:hypothetical protein